MLIAFAIFGISVAVGLVTLVVYLNPGLFGRNETSILGTVEPEPLDNRLQGIHSLTVIF